VFVLKVNASNTSVQARAASYSPRCQEGVAILSFPPTFCIATYLATWTFGAQLKERDDAFNCPCFATSSSCSFLLRSKWRGSVTKQKKISPFVRLQVLSVLIVCYYEGQIEGTPFAACSAHGASTDVFILSHLLQLRRHDSPVLFYSIVPPLQLHLFEQRPRIPLVSLFVHTSINKSGQY
jgi:hypothetical protein